MSYTLTQLALRDAPIAGYKGYISVEDNGNEVYRKETASFQEGSEFVRQYTPYTIESGKFTSDKTCMGKLKTLFFPNFFDTTSKTDNIAIKIIRAIAQILLDLITLIPRLIIALFRTSEDIPPKCASLQELIPSALFTDGIAVIYNRSTTTHISESNHNEYTHIAETKINETITKIKIQETDTSIASIERVEIDKATMVKNKATGNWIRKDTTGSR